MIQPNLPEKKLTLDDIVAPIFDAAMGRRLILIRKKHLMDQGELGARLGILQRTVCDLERGNLAVPRNPFTLARLKEVFGSDLGYILYGNNAARYNSGFILTRFHNEKFRVNRKKPESRSNRSVLLKRKEAKSGL